MILHRVVWGALCLLSFAAYGDLANMSQKALRQINDYNPYLAAELDRKSKPSTVESVKALLVAIKQEEMRFRCEYYLRRQVEPLPDELKQHLLTTFSGQTFDLRGVKEPDVAQFYGNALKRVYWSLEAAFRRWQADQWLQELNDGSQLPVIEDANPAKIVADYLLQANSDIMALRNNAVSAEEVAAKLKSYPQLSSEQIHSLLEAFVLFSEGDRDRAEEKLNQITPLSYLNSRVIRSWQDKSYNDSPVPCCKSSGCIGCPLNRRHRAKD